MKTGITVYDAMTSKPIMLEPSDSLKHCAQEMADQHVGAILVMKRNQMKGIITEKDIVRKCVAEGINPQTKKIGDFMWTGYFTISPNKDIYDALLIMRDQNTRHLPVLDGEKVVGLLTIKDILKIEPQLFELIVEKFELKEEENKPVYNQGKEGICQECGELAKELRDVDGVMICNNCAS